MAGDSIEMTNADKEWLRAVEGLDRGVAAGLLLVAVDYAHPHEAHIVEVVDSAVRGGLLIDLTLAGRVSEDSTDLGVDTAPTGYPPADEALRSIAEHPTDSLERWLHGGRPHARVVADALVEAGTLQRGQLRPHHYRRPGAAPAPATIPALARAFDDASAPTAAAAALTVLAASIGYLGPDRRSAAPPDLLAQCQAARGITSGIVEYLTTAIADIRAAGVANTEAILLGGGT